jgi:putative ABC transport system permease protein
LNQRLTLLAGVISAVGIPMPPPPNSNLGYAAKLRVVPSAVAGAFAIGFFATVPSRIADAAHTLVRGRR